MDLKGLKVIAQGRARIETAEERWDFCKSCPYITSRHRCMHCGCFMKSKVKFKNASCPIGIWDKEKKNEVK
tara:strand:- start:131 stop:343 length:213 start_codon:yes stop_codon:yes gene_type:complete